MSCHWSGKSDMKVACEKIEDFGMHINFQDSSLNTPFWVSSVIPKRGSYDSPGGEKNNMWSLWYDLPYALRPEDPPSSRPLLRRYADLPGGGDPSSFLSQVSESEARKAGLAGRLSLLYQAVCLLRGPSLPRFEYPGRGQRVAFGLEDRQILGEAIHARAGAPGRNTWTQGVGYR